jgi:hypothetical protein
VSARATLSIQFMSAKTPHTVRSLYLMQYLRVAERFKRSIKRDAIRRIRQSLQYFRMRHGMSSFQQKRQNLLSKWGEANPLYLPDIGNRHLATSITDKQRNYVAWYQIVIQETRS